MSMFQRTLAFFVVLAACCVGLGAAVAGPANDFNARLNGDYAFVQTRVCSQGAAGAAGIDQNLVLLSPNSTRTTALRGVMSFDGRGSGTFHSDELQLNASITTPAVPLGPPGQQTGGAESTCELTYAVDAGGRVLINLVNCTADGVSGAISGLHFTATDIALDGHLSTDGKTLLLSDVAARVSTVTTVTTGGPVVSFRVCSRSGTAVRVR